MAPAKTFPATPIPPATVTAPVVVLVDARVFATVNILPDGTSQELIPVENGVPLV
jgi:hypothetical protein